MTNAMRGATKVQLNSDIKQIPIFILYLYTQLVNRDIIIELVFVESSCSLNSIFLYYISRLWP